jgi:hypothetical protein
MADERVLQEAAIALQQEWGLTLPVLLTEEEILCLLKLRVISLAEKGAESFYQLMYRLDISEKKLHAAMGDEDVAARIAKLIYERQIQKIVSRRIHTPPPPGEDEDADMRL